MLRRHFKQFLISGARNISKYKRREILQDVDSMKQFNFNSKRRNLKVYVCGLAQTGALGIEKSLKEHKQAKCVYVQHPSRLTFGEKTEVLDVSAGYGFSVFIVKSDENGISVLGTGLNTDSQIGYHRHMGETNKPIEVLIYPAPIRLPKASEDEKHQAVRAGTGRAHTVILTEAGTVFTLGNNAYGQCARAIIPDEEYFASKLVHRVNPEYFNDQKVTDVFCGQDHTMFLTESGSIFSCGWGADGQTGLGHFNNQHTPELVGGDVKGEKIVKLSSTADCVLALNDKGEVFGWGNSEYGQVVQEGTQQISVPVNLKPQGIGKIIDIAAGGSFCAVLNEAGDVFVWGFGLLGLGPEVEYCRNPTIIPPTLFGRNAFNSESRVISINCGLNHLAAINSDHDLFTWGRNKFGCLGLGHIKDQYFPIKSLVTAKVEKVKCGVDHTITLCRKFNESISSN